VLDANTMAAEVTRDAEQPHFAVAVQDDIAAGRDCRARAFRNRTGQRPHGNVVIHRIANHVTHYSCRNRRRLDPSTGTMGPAAFRLVKSCVPKIFYIIRAELVALPQKRRRAV
jgi:hypothetical protein